MPVRVRAVLLAALVIAALVATAPPRIVGDGVEYVSQAMNFASGHGPSFGRRDMRDVETRLKAIDPELADWSIERATIAGRDRTRDFQHFWVYGLAATPFLWVTDLAHAHPAHAFTLLNGALLLAAIWIVLPRVGPTTTALLFFSPLVWWIDKPHTEVFTVSLMAMAMALMRERPGWAMALAGIAATQNPPIAVLVPIVAAVAVHDRGARALRDPGLVAGGVIGAAAAAMQPTYSYVMHGTPSLLLTATIPGVPSLAEIAVVPFDLNVGLIAGFPALAVVMVGAVIVAARQRPTPLLRADVLGAAVASIVLLVAFASTANLHHGATPGMTRYALWLVPLAIPLLAAVQAQHRAAWTRALVVLTAASAVFSVLVFHPARPENWTQPTRLSAWLWTHHPAWSNPMPEVFAETLRHDDRTVVPTTTRQCEKILIGADVFPDGTWPVPCAPVPLPAACSGPGRLCYANRAGDGYAIVAAPGRPRPVAPDGRVWPRAAEAQVLTWYNERGWWPLLAHVGDLEAMRAAIGVRAITLGTAARFVVTLERPTPDATLTFRLPSPMNGLFLDPMTGRTIASVAFDGTTNELFSVPVPAGHDILILDMSGVSN